MAAWSRWVGGRARWPVPRRLLRRHLSQARILGAPASCGTSAPSAELWHVSEALTEGLTRLGVKTPNAVQAEAIPLAVSGRDVLVVSQTGSGKTLMFLLPILQRLAASVEAEAAGGASCDASCDVTALVLAPTAALASQHMAVARQLAAGLPTPPIIRSLESLDLDSLDTESIDTDAEGIDTEGAGSPQSQPRSQSQSRPRSRPRARARLLIGTPECWLARPDLGL
eukprot:scaffold114356_cov64-Phaeocystis_antarctica.AAC.1